MGEPRDAVVIGAGPNGLVAANVLIDQGWNVLLLESQPIVGGGVRSDSEVEPGFVHDTFSSFYPLGAVSPVIRALGLEDHGLRWTRAPAVLGNPMPDGSWAVLHHDVEATARGLDALHPGDGDAWLRLHDDWTTIGPAVTEALLTPFPPVRAGLKALRHLRKVGGLDYVRTLLEPVATMGGKRFSGEAGQLLLAGNAMHADIPMTASGSGILGLLLAMIGQTDGFPVPEGGAGMLSRAMANRFVARGGVIRCGTRVASITLDNNRATGVVTEHGEHVRARAIVADVAATALYGQLIEWSDLPEKVRRGMRRFEQDPATIKVDWALSRQVPWTNAPELGPGTVHLADSVDDLAHSQDAIVNHTVPANPFLLIGQMATADPSRAPAGAESLWAYTHVPQVVRRDEGPDGLTGSWDDDEIRRMADRMQARIERYAPGFSSTIISRRVLGPHQLESLNENLVKGALGGGTSGLHQQLVFRPIAGLGRAETAFRGLFLGSASAHPGGGVHGACGANAARAVQAAARVGRL